VRTRTAASPACLDGYLDGGDSFGIGCCPLKDF
jgi:hypothetical protein